jgi:hypothetical protein
VEERRKGLENAPRAKPLDIKEQYERQIKELQDAYGEWLYFRRRAYLERMTYWF